MKTPLTYMFFIISCMFPLIASPQMVNITGKISNSETGKIIENANIFESKSTIGTITDKFGFFKLMLTSGDAEILITCQGFTDFKQKISLKKDTVLSVKLEPLSNLKAKQKETAELQSEKKETSSNLKRQQDQ
ncbi:MAG: carboxypeptidase-like regulatory domain-containing protein [Draconibacterium sp.]